MEAGKGGETYSSRAGWASHLRSEMHKDATFTVQHRFDFVQITPAVLEHLQSREVAVETIYGPPVIYVFGGPKRRTRRRANPWVRRDDLKTALLDLQICRPLTQTLTRLLQVTQDPNKWGPVGLGT